MVYYSKLRYCTQTVQSACSAHVQLTKMKNMYHIFVSIWISRQPENNLPNLNQMSRKLFGVKAMTRLVAMAKPI